MNALLLVKIFLTATFISMLSTPFVIKIYKHFGFLDDPKKNKRKKNTHKYPVPRGGGISIYLGILISCLIYMEPDKSLYGILAGGFIILTMGVLDDIFDLSPYLRLLGGFLASLVVIAVGIGIPYVTNPLGGGVIMLNKPQIPIDIFGKTRTIWILADLFALFWITWCMNFVNWSKGLDGQLPGIVIFAGLTIGILSLKFSSDATQWPVIILAFILSGAYFGFLPWNFYPQKIMPGYGGGALAGYMLAVLTILSNTKVGTGAIVLAVPMIDAIYAIIRRLKAGQSPVWGDRGHLHHKLMDLGWGKRKIACFYWIISALFGFLSLTLNSQAKLYTIILLVFIFGGLILWLNYFSSSLNQPDQSNG